MASQLLLLPLRLRRHHRIRPRFVYSSSTSTPSNPFLASSSSFSTSSSSPPPSPLPRHAVVVGAGLQGVATAYALRKQGIQKIIILERGPEAACYASHANCGMICPILSQPLNSVGTARMAVASALKAMMGVEVDRRFSNEIVVGRRQLIDPHFVAWGVLFLAHCKEEMRRKAARDMYGLAEYSAKRIEEVVKEMGMEEEVGLRREGALKVWGEERKGEEGAGKAVREAKALLFPQVERRWQQLRGACSSSSLGSSLLPISRVPDAQACVDFEPALAHTHATATYSSSLLPPPSVLGGGGVFYPDISIGDARAFTQGLARRLVEEGGVLLKTGVNVVGLENKGGGEGGREGGKEATAVCLEGGERVEADVVVLACGALSQRLLSSCSSSSSFPSSSFPSSMSLPIVPMKGYSLSLPLPPSLPPSLLPTRCLILDDRQVYISRLGGREGEVLRVGGLAEFVGVDTATGGSSGSSSSSSSSSSSTAPLEKLMDAVRMTFPALTRAAGWEEMNWKERGAWSGLRPTTPDSLPILGPLLERREGGRGGGWRNVFVNAGHGTMGWTLSVGSAEVVAALVVGKSEESPVDPMPFALSRFGWREVLRRKGGRVGGKEEERERERERAA